MEISKRIGLEKVGLMPQEEMLDVKKKRKKLIIGVLKENSPVENRVALAPHAVELLVDNGHEVLIEKDAGKAAHFKDMEYSEAGGKIVKSSSSIYSADIIMKVSPLKCDEIDNLKGRQIIISALQASTQSKEYIEKLLVKKVTALAFEYIRDANMAYPVVRSMSEIAGSTSILIAAEYLSNVNNGKGEMLGGITGISPTEVVIIGAGTAGEFATRTALGLGAMVKVFDTSVYRLRRLQNNLGTRIFTSILQPRVLKKAMRTADVVIGAIHLEENFPQFLVAEDTVEIMKPMSVIVDISIDHGGCFETSSVTSHENAVFTKHNVLHYCVPNIPSRVARTASYALSNIFGLILLHLGESGGINQLIKVDTGLRSGVYIYEGILTKEHIADKFDLPFQDIDLLMAAF
ncbi:MAG: alanine dehydrogenase [Chlorobi bacterium]|nr:alanine dehydrogenase [Chlorobiota bacterium]